MAPEAGVVSPPPPAGVLEAFGAEAPPRLLRGGQGTAWLAGSVVLKPRDLPLAALRWQATVLPGLQGRPDVRVAGPLRTRDGRLTVAGWTAWPYLPGTHLPGRWRDIVATGRALSAAVRDLPRPAFLARRDDPWAAADRVAWGESPVEPFLGLATVRDLTVHLRPVHDRAQIVHGDLTGNVLFHQGLPPAVIDLSVYWRPPTLAAAVVVADAMVWEGADERLLRTVAADAPGLAQCLLRALLFRIVTDSLQHPSADAEWEEAYRPTVAITCAFAGGRGDPGRP